MMGKHAMKLLGLLMYLVAAVQRTYSENLTYEVSVLPNVLAAGPTSVQLYSNIKCGVNCLGNCTKWGSGTCDGNCKPNMYVSGTTHRCECSCCSFCPAYRKALEAKVDEWTPREVGLLIVLLILLLLHAIVGSIIVRLLLDRAKRVRVKEKTVAGSTTQRHQKDHPALTPTVARRQSLKTSAAAYPMSQAHRIAEPAYAYSPKGRAPEDWHQAPARQYEVIIPLSGK